MSDLVERLLKPVAHERREGFYTVTTYAPDPLRAEAASRISQQDAELERVRRELEEARATIERLTQEAIIGEYMWTPAELHEARREAFFQGWEMSNTGGMEDTCADAWAFWCLMEDGRDEVEPDRYSRRAKAEETRT